MGFLNELINKDAETKAAKEVAIKAKEATLAEELRKKRLEEKRAELKAAKEKLQALKSGDKILKTIDSNGKKVSKEFTAFSDDNNILAGNCRVEGEQYFYIIYEANQKEKQKYNMILAHDKGVQTFCFAEGDHPAYYDERVLTGYKLMLDKKMKIFEISDEISSKSFEASKLYATVKKTEQLIKDTEDTNSNENQ